MKSILRLGKEDMDVTVQPGISYDELNEQLKVTGLFFPMDPGPGACIGVMTFHDTFTTTNDHPLMFLCNRLGNGWHILFRNSRGEIRYNERECD